MTHDHLGLMSGHDDNVNRPTRDTNMEAVILNGGNAVHLIQVTSRLETRLTITSASCYVHI